MIYSVWRPELRQYDYYEDGVQTAAFPTPRHLSGRIAADAAGWPLPGGARKVGAGPVVRGQVATSGTDGFVSNTYVFIGIGILGYALWRLMKEKR